MLWHSIESEGTRENISSIYKTYIICITMYLLGNLVYLKISTETVATGFLVIKSKRQRNGGNRS